MKFLRSTGWLLGVVLSVACLLPRQVHAQYVPPYISLQGYLTSSSGLPAQNGTLTFRPSQVFFIAGTQVVVTESQCATDVGGQVVGVGNPLTAPRVTPQLTGTLPAGNYYVKFTWYDQFGAQTLASPEVAVQLTGTGELNVLPPVGNGPPNAMGMNVYISATPGAETYQGHTTTTTAGYVQAIPLVTGAALPISNSTTCRVIANDAGWPTGTGYTVSLVDPSGNTLFDYPEMWQFFGPGSAYNLSQGIPYYHGQVTYPVPILTTPYNHNMQSISGPLSMGLPGVYYPIVGVQALGVDTDTPAWGVDVEGTALLSEINAAGGYLVNGNGGTTGQCLLSDGTAYDTPGNCVTSIPAIYYQTILTGPTAASALPSQSYLEFPAANSGLLAANAVGVFPNVTRTVVELNVVGGADTLSSDQYAVVTAAGGTAGYFACWDGTTGGITSSSSPCAGSSQDQYTTFESCVPVTDGDNQNCQGGPITWPTAFSDADYYMDGCLVDDSSTYTSSPAPTAFVTVHLKTATSFSYTMTAVKGSSGPYPYTWPVTCHAHHQ